jgi:hypothetical protein
MIPSFLAGHQEDRMTYATRDAAFIRTHFFTGDALSRIAARPLKPPPGQND